MNKMEEKIRAIIVDQLCVDPSEVTPEANFKDDLGCDSMDLIELVMEFESEFGVEVPDADIEGLHTVQDVYDYISKNKQY